MPQHKAHQPLDWNMLVHDAIEFLSPVGNEHQTSYNQIAEAIGTHSNAVTQICVTLRAIDGLRVRQVVQGGRGIGRGGRKAFYTLLLDEAEIQRRIKARNWTVGKLATYLEAHGILAAQDEIMAKPQVETTAQTKEHDYRGVKGFEALRPMRKDEPHALVEAAKQYRDRAAFIDEEIARFAARGLQLTPVAIGGYGSDERLEYVSQVLPYIEQLERTNERLNDQVNKTAAPSADLARARGEISALRNQVERLIAERTQAGDMVGEERKSAREKLQARDREIERLNGLLLEVQRASGAINGAVKDPQLAAR